MAERSTTIAVRLKELANRKIPIIQWLPKYSGRTALADFIAGITVGLTLIPQSIAYAALAGLSPQFGLYASMTGGLAYMVFGTIPEINIAPTALLSLLTYNYTHDTHPSLAVLLCFLAGCVELVCGILNLGFLVEFVSMPVVAGFTSAASIIIASSQVKNLIGLKFNAEGFLEIWSNVFHNIEHMQKWDTILSVSCCAVLLGLRQMKNIAVPVTNSENKEKNLLKNVLWFISVARNAVVVLCCAIAAYAFDLHDMKPFSLTEQVDSGLPPVSSPPFEVTYGNQTLNFIGMASHLGSGILVVPLIAILGNIAIAKSFAHGKTVDASQEMLTLGICNIIGSFFSSMPVNGSFSRSAVNNASGVKTPFGGLYTGIMVILALGFLTPYFSYIPKATLASVIICAVIFMVEISIIKPMWYINRLNLVPYFVTFLACLFLGVELGILVGIAVDLLFMLYFTARPRIQVEAVTIQNENGPNFTSLKPEGAVLFPAVEHMRRAIAKAGDNSKVIVIDCVYVTRADYTAAKGIGAAVSDLKSVGKQVIFLRLKPEIREILASFCEDKCKFIDKEEYLVDIFADISQRKEDSIDKNEDCSNVTESKTGFPNETAISIFTINSNVNKGNSLKKYKKNCLLKDKKWTFSNCISSPKRESKNFMTRL